MIDNLLNLLRAFIELNTFEYILLLIITAVIFACLGIMIVCLGHLICKIFEMITYIKKRWGRND